MSISNRILSGMVDTIRIRIRIQAEIWKQMQYQWYRSVSDSFSSLVPRRRKCLIACSYLNYVGVNGTFVKDRCANSGNKKERVCVCAVRHNTEKFPNQHLQCWFVSIISEALQLLFNRSVVYTTVRERARTLLQESQESIDGMWELVLSSPRLTIVMVLVTY